MRGSETPPLKSKAAWGPFTAMLLGIFHHRSLWGVLLLCWLALLAACAPTGIYHTVLPGQTLYRIAKTYDVDERELARVNHINDPTTLKVNQRLFVPGVTQSRSVAVPTITPPAAPAPPAKPATPAPPAPPARQEPAVSESKPAVVKPPARGTTTAVKPAKGIFVWPAKGKLLNRFGKNGQNTYKGIEIGLPAGTPVAAAAAGKVIFSGNAIRGYGNLVILEHSDGYFTVYGYNQKNLATLNDHVGQGDRIALSGTPPNGQSPRLHFEIRHGKGAVDPLFFLP